MIQYEGAIWRPPSEAHSLIVQATVGCAHNQCTFCTMYKDKKFRIRSVEEIKQDIAYAAEAYGEQIRKLFLADGDALSMPTEDLLAVLAYAKEKMPWLVSISSYGTALDVIRKGEKQLKELKEAGLSMIYMGAESGDETILKEIRKGITKQQLIEAGKLLKQAGILNSLTLISGLGGRKLLKEHAINSADLVSKIKPEYLGFLTLMLDEEAIIYEKIKNGEMELLQPEDVMEEMKLFLEHVDSEGTIFRSNHASNYVMLKGTLNEDRDRMLAQIKKAEDDSLFRKENYRRL
jgi:radical SAM superfamily enzyme YgiQ (UPF0313 family)